MSDVFSRLVARARDAAPRVRPVIAPRFAPRTAPLPLEELDVEVEAPRAGVSPAARFNRPDPERSLASPQVEVPAQHSPLQVASSEASVARDSASPPAPAATDGHPAAAALTLERTIERIFQTRSERIHEPTAQRPVAEPPPPLHPADLAVLRPAVPGPLAPRATSPSARREGAEAAEVAPRPGREPDAIRISIGRIDVRATSPSPARAAPSRPRPLPLGLDDYLRRRNEER